MVKSICLVLGSVFVLRAVPMPQASQDLQLQSQDSSPLNRIGLDKAVRSGLAQRWLSEEQVSFLGQPTPADLIEAELSRGLPQNYRHQSRKIASILLNEAWQAQLDPVLVLAVIAHESKFDPTVLGTHGEVGLMQIKPTTVQWLMQRSHKSVIPDEVELKAKLADPVFNIRYGVKYLSYLSKSFKGSRNLYLSAYNLGSNKLRAKMLNGQMPQEYSKKVLNLFDEYSKVTGMNNVYHLDHVWSLANL